MGCCDNNNFVPFVINPVTGLPISYQPMPPACNCPPSPIPPWHRPVQSGRVQTIKGTGSVDLMSDTTLLVATVNNPPKPISVTLPNGNFQRQMKRIYIPGDQIANSESFNVTGKYAGYDTLTFNQLGFSAVLEWDGATWQIIGGNATPNDPDVGGEGVAGYQTLLGPGAIDLTTRGTWLIATGSDVGVILPDGEFQGQMHYLFIPSDQAATTANFIVGGTIAGGFTKLKLSSLGTSASLLWDGGGWQLVGGNAEPS